MSQITQEIVIKALQRAESKGLGTKETAELIIDYMDIAGALSSATQPVTTNVKTASGAIVTPSHTEESIAPPQTTLEAPVLVGKVIGKKADDNVWTTDTLVEALNAVEWSFVAEPPGIGRQLQYRGVVIANPRGMEGAGVVFSCPEVTTPRDIPVFFTLGQKDINPKQMIADVKHSIEQQLSSLKTKPQNKAVALTSYPSDIESAGICGGNIV